MTEDAIEEVRVERVCNLYDDFNPVPWEVCDVEILYEDGEAVGFYGYERPGWYRNQFLGIEEFLPTEIFNHQLKTLDVNDPEAVAKFMGTYGIIYDSFPQGADEMNDYCKMASPMKWGLPSKENILALCGDNPHSYPRSPERFDTLALWRKELLEMLNHYSEGNDPRQWKPKLFMVSYKEVRANIELIFECVALAKALATTDDPVEIEKMMGWGDGGWADEMMYYDWCINQLISNISPKIGYTCIVDGVTSPHATYENVFEEIDDNYVAGSFMRAVGLQIRNFNLNLSSCRECKECGELFISKQSKGRKRTSHSDSEFCCDRCKNRFAQREYRKSPGYKLKQSKKSESD